MIFISALWPPRSVLAPANAARTQFTGLHGQQGALAAAGPLAAALHTFGWTPSYAVAASFGVVTGIALVLLVKDSPWVDQHRDELRLRALGRTLRAAWLVPGTRLGLWSHFTSQFSANMFTMLWGFPFLISGQGLTSGRRVSCSRSWSSRPSCRARSSAR